MVKKRWPNFKQHRSKTKCDAARWCPAPPATARTHTRGHRSVSKDGPVWKAGGDRAGPLWQRCEGNRSKEGNVTTAGRHGPRNGRPPTLSPPPPLLLSPLGLCPLWRELGSPPALSGACRRRPFTADSPHHVLAGETGQCPGTGRYFSPSSQGPAARGGGRRQSQEAATTRSHRNGGCDGSQRVPRAPRCCLLPRSQVRLHHW